MNWQVLALIWAAAFAFAAVGAPDVRAVTPEPSRNEKFGLEVTFPDKWLVGSGEGSVLLISRSTDPEAQANCLATGEIVEKTKDLTQGQLNQALAQPFGAEFWQGVYGRSGLDAEVKYAVARAHISGIVVQEALFDLSKSGDQKSKVSVHQAIFIAPGRTISLACSTRAIAYPKFKTALDAVIESVRISNPKLPVASAATVVMPVSDSFHDSLQDLDKSATAGVGVAGALLFQLSK